MASNQSIGSPFARQLSARSRKLHVYETLFLLNESMDRAIGLLRIMKNLPSADKRSIQYAIIEIDEVRCGMNADFIECQADNERSDQGRFWKQRRELEKEWHDPDDVYIDVQRREDDRRKQGLPPRLGVLPQRMVKGQRSFEPRPKRKNKDLVSSLRSSREENISAEY